MHCYRLRFCRLYHTITRDFNDIYTKRYITLESTCIYSGIFKNYPWNKTLLMCGYGFCLKLICTIRTFYTYMYMYKCINSAESSNRFVKCLNSPILETDNTRTCSVSRLDRRHDYFSMFDWTCSPRSSVFQNLDVCNSNYTTNGTNMGWYYSKMYMVYLIRDNDEHRNNAWSTSATILWGKENNRNIQIH